MTSPWYFGAGIAAVVCGFALGRGAPLLAVIDGATAVALAAIGHSGTREVVR